MILYKQKQLLASGPGKTCISQSLRLGVGGSFRYSHKHTESNQRNMGVGPIYYSKRFYQRVFDRNAKRMQRDQAAVHPESKSTDYLKDEMARRLVDRMSDISRKFPNALDLGSGPGHFAKQVNGGIEFQKLRQQEMEQDEDFDEDDDLDMDSINKVESVTMCDLSENLLYRDKDEMFPVVPKRIVADEEKLPFADGTFDVVVSNLNLHWTNDLVGSLKEVKRVLKKDSLFTGAIFCDETLYQLRCSLQLAEMERKGGFSPRTAPAIRSSEFGSLLHGAGFKLLTVDTDHITVNYPSIFEVIEDLKAMGESNCTLKRAHMLSRDTLIAAGAIYQELYGNEDGTVPATFEVVFFVGWTPDPSQMVAKERGSAELSLKDLGEHIN